MVLSLTKKNPLQNKQKPNLTLLKNETTYLSIKVIKLTVSFLDSCDVTIINNFDTINLHKIKMQREYRT